MKRRILPRIPGTIRNKGYVAAEDEITEKLRFLAKQHNCSVSFVQNTIMAEALNVKVKAHYYDYKNPVRKFKKPA